MIHHAGGTKNVDITRQLLQCVRDAHAKSVIDRNARQDQQQKETEAIKSQEADKQLENKKR